MKRIWTTLTVLATVISICMISALAQAAWIIEQEESISTAPKAMNTKMTFDKDRMRADNDAMGTSIILDFAKDSMFMVQHGPKMYMEVTLSIMTEQMNQTMAQMKPDGEKAPEITFKETKETKKINGFPCVRHAMIRDGKEFGSMWITSKLGNKMVLDVYQRFIDMSSPAGSKASPLAAAKKALAKGFPVMIEQTLNDGTKIHTEVKSATEKKLDDSYFQPPKEYQAVRPQDVMGGGPGGPGGPGAPPAAPMVP